MQNLPESPSPVLFQMGGGEATHNLPQHWSLTLKPHGIVGLHSGRREPAMEPPPSAVPDAAAHLHHRGAQGSASGLTCALETLRGVGNAGEARCTL